MTKDHKEAIIFLFIGIGIGYFIHSLFLPEKIVEKTVEIPLKYVPYKEVCDKNDGIYAMQKITNENSYGYSTLFYCEVEGQKYSWSDTDQAFVGFKQLKK